MKMSSASTILIGSLFLASLSLISGTYQEWCIADEQFPEDVLQKAMVWACVKGGANCSQIQPTQPCYLPNTTVDHASYAFNSYYQKFKHSGGNCYFDAAAHVTGQDPSYGRCVYEYTP